MSRVLERLSMLLIILTTKCNESLFPMNHANMPFTRRLDYWMLVNSPSGAESE